MQDMLQTGELRIVEGIGPLHARLSVSRALAGHLRPLLAIYGRGTGR